MNAQEARQFQAQLEKERLKTEKQEREEERVREEKYRKERIPVVKYYFENIFPDELKEAIKKGSSYLHYGSRDFEMNGESKYLWGDTDYEILTKLARKAGFSVRWEHDKVRYSDESDLEDVTSVYIEW